MGKQQLAAQCLGMRQRPGIGSDFVEHFRMLWVSVEWEI